MNRGDKSRRRVGPPAAVTGALALLLVVVCLAEGATGSCLSYGHSCWGAHGKRSGKPPVTAPDWFITKLFHRVDADGEMARARQNSNNVDIGAIFQGDMSDDSPANGSDEEIPIELAENRNTDAKPMIDDQLLSKMKLLQLLREVSEEQ